MQQIRTLFRNTVIGMCVAAVIFIVVTIVTSYATHNNVYVIIIGVLWFLCVSASFMLSAFKEMKVQQEVSSIVHEMLQEGLYTQVVPTKECADYHIFNFLGGICTFYATISNSNEVQIVGKFHTKDQFAVREFRSMTFKEFLKEYNTISNTEEKFTDE